MPDINAAFGQNLQRASIHQPLMTLSLLNCQLIPNESTWSQTGKTKRMYDPFCFVQGALGGRIHPDRHTPTCLMTEQKTLKTCEVI